MISNVIRIDRARGGRGCTDAPIRYGAASCRAPRPRGSPRPRWPHVGERDGGDGPRRPREVKDEDHPRPPTLAGAQRRGARLPRARRSGGEQPPPELLRPALGEAAQLHLGGMDEGIRRRLDRRRSSAPPPSGGPPPGAQHDPRWGPRAPSRSSRRSRAAPPRPLGPERDPTLSDRPSRSPSVGCACIERVDGLPREYQRNMIPSLTDKLPLCST